MIGDFTLELVKPLVDKINRVTTKYGYDEVFSFCVIIYLILLSFFNDKNTMKAN